MIFEGFAGGGESSSVREAHLRSIRSGETLEVQAVSKLPRLDTTITFSDFDMEGCQHPHDDPLVIRVVVANKTVHRYRKGEAGTDECLLIGIFRGKGTATWVSPTSTHFRKSPMSSCNSGKVSHSRCSLGVQYVTGLTFAQCFEGRPLRLSYGCQVPNRERSRSGSRRPLGSQGMLLGVNKTKNCKKCPRG